MARANSKTRIVSSFGYMEKRVFRLGTYNKSPRKPTYLRKARHTRIMTCSYFPSGSSASNSSFCTVLRGKLYINIIPLCSAIRILVLPKRDDLLPQHAKRLLGKCMQRALNTIDVRTTSSAGLPSGCMNIRVASPNRWKTERMSAVTVFGGKPV
jgi:hypothetical protein